MGARTVNVRTSHHPEDRHRLRERSKDFRDVVELDGPAAACTWLDSDGIRWFRPFASRRLSFSSAAHLPRSWRNARRDPGLAYDLLRGLAVRV